LTEKNQYVVCALYQFVKISDLDVLKTQLRILFEDHMIRGTILIAHEGINGTVSGKRESIDSLLNFLKDKGFLLLSIKESISSEIPFLRSKVKIKPEIVTMGLPDIDPNKSAGTYVKPEDWNDLISDPDVTVIDTRNIYEVNVGTFQGAINPNTESFREFPRFVEKNLVGKKNRKIAMFCTGGIRCEKSTSFLKENGFENIYHLEGGILKYLETVPEDESLWQGECFVFDDRVTVDHGLVQGSYDQCHACRMPITDEDKSTGDFTQGISCPHCIRQKTDRDRERFRERQKQIELLEKRQEKHLGKTGRKDQEARKAEKIKRMREKDRQT